MLSSYAPHAEDPTGEGADLAFSGCDRSFSGLAACNVSDTVFVNGHAAMRGGAVTISDGDDVSSELEFHRCMFDNSSSGTGIAYDPQGHGGALWVAKGATILLSDCLFINNNCGDKVHCFACFASLRFTKFTATIRQGKGGTLSLIRSNLTDWRSSSTIELLCNFCNPIFCVVLS